MIYVGYKLVSKHSRNMRLIIITLSILFYTKTIFAQGSKNVVTNFDSPKFEIQKFESRIYKLPVDSIIDSTRIYYSIYQIESLVKIKKNSQVKRKKSHSYSLRENDSISLTQLNKENKNNVFWYFQTFGFMKCAIIEYNYFKLLMICQGKLIKK